MNASSKDAMQIITFTARGIGMTILTYLLVVIPKDVAKLPEVLQSRTAT